jgi:hypothetical protein
VVIASVVLCFATWFAIEKTSLGRTLRAATENPRLTRAFGVNVPALMTLGFGVGVALAGAAGVFAAPIYQVGPLMGADLVILVFAVVVVGGMGSILGSVVTSIILGLLEGLTKVFYPPGANIRGVASLGGTPEMKTAMWTLSETGGLPRPLFSSPELVKFKSFDGREIPAFVNKPKIAKGKKAGAEEGHQGQGQIRQESQKTAQSSRRTEESGQKEFPQAGQQSSQESRPAQGRAALMNRVNSVIRSG